MKDFFARHFGRILFVIVTAIVTVMAIVSNNGYGNFFQGTTDRGTSHYTHYHDNDTYDRNRSNRQPWKYQKPSSTRSSKSSSSGHK